MKIVNGKLCHQLIIFIYNYFNDAEITDKPVFISHKPVHNLFSYYQPEFWYSVEITYETNFYLFN